jgi:hypothetical protein
VNDDDKKPSEPDIVDRLLAALDRALDTFHDKVLRPIIVAARIIAFGFIIALAALILVIVLIIGFIRLLNVYAFHGRDWLSYVSVGALSYVAGLIIWRQRRPLKLRK